MVELHRLQPQRIVLIKPSALGDVVHTLPVLTALRLLYPRARIVWVINAELAPLLQGHPDLDAIIPFERQQLRWNRPLAVAAAVGRLVRRLRQERFDLALDLQGLLRSGLVCWASGATVRVGFAHAREGSHWAYTHRLVVSDAGRIHAVQRYWRVVEALGGGDLPQRFYVPLDPRELVAVDEALRGRPRPWLAVAVGARWPTKRWPAEFFATLLQRTLATYGGTVLLLGSAADRPHAAMVARRLGEAACDWTGQTSLPRLAATLAACDVMIANDTGPLHLAAALGRPCIAPYTCTQPTRHGPYVVPGTANIHGVTTARVPCAGSYRRRCRAMICMDELTPERLWPQVVEVLERWQRLSRAA